MRPSIYNFDNSIDFLRYELERKKTKNPRFSLRAWSTQLQFKNPAFLSQILAGKRKLKLDLAKKISQNLALSGSEAQYFEALVLLENARTAEEKSLVHDLLTSIHDMGKNPPVPMSLDTFKFVTDWHHVAILEILNLKKFDGTTKFIEDLLAHLMTSAQVKSAIERLIRLDLIANTKGKLSRKKDSSLLIDSQVPSEAVRNYHTQMIQRGLQSVEEQSLEQRSLRSSTLCFRKEDFEKAKQIIADCHKKLCRLSREKDGEEIYQMNTQLFQLITLKKKARNL